MTTGGDHNPYLVQSLMTTVLSAYDNPHKLPQRYHWLFQKGYLKESEIDQLQADEEALYSITPANDANTMSKLCANLLGMEHKTLGRKPVITDGCACVGGNVLSFALSGLFAQVNAVEFNADRAHMLKHNVDVIRHRVQTPVNILTGSYTDWMQTLDQDIVFLDPPWGGPDYKTKQSVSLSLGNTHLADIVLALYFNNRAMYVVWKAPKNFNLDEMQDKLLREQSDLDVMVLREFKKYILYYVSLKKKAITQDLDVYSNLKQPSR